MNEAIPDEVNEAARAEVANLLLIDTEKMLLSTHAQLVLDAVTPILAAHFAKELELAEDQANNLAGDLAVVSKERDDLQAVIAEAYAVQHERSDTLDVWRQVNAILSRTPSGTVDRLRAEGWQEGWNQGFRDFQAAEIEDGYLALTPSPNPFLTPKGADSE